GLCWCVCCLFLWWVFGFAGVLGLGCVCCVVVCGGGCVVGVGFGGVVVGCVVVVWVGCGVGVVVVGVFGVVVVGGGVCGVCVVGFCWCGDMVWGLWVCLWWGLVFGVLLVLLRLGLLEGVVVLVGVFVVGLLALSVVEASVWLSFQVIDSPFCGKEGKFVTSRNFKERLDKELLY
ncbi:hypothetical protein RA267_27715, partial [Pseudomonas syringae pv. tagetis]|uniref:hypothetical protein n=1 Tax=Pseudomonas syringae group genomosp. 7 TaxID=251699 RepID=UPI003770452E